MVAIKEQSCPFCDGNLIPGHIYAPESRAVYWLPETESNQGIIVTEENVKKSGGFVLGTVRRIGFIAKKRAESLYCEQCKRLISIIE
jgi:hypothetical protein